MITEIYCDLDGVLVDFEDKALEIVGFLPDRTEAGKRARKEFWQAISAHVKRGGKFFADMKKLHDADELWKYIHTLGVPVRICSATGHTRGAGDEKRSWVAAHLSQEAADTAIFVRDGKDKAAHAHAAAILIDDRVNVITPWIEAGGIGILHTSTESTIAKLKEYQYGV